MANLKMKLIPVIDLKGGQVVAARLGNRRDYAPLVSPLCDSSSLPEVASAILRLYPFDTVYIADLDAIDGGPGHLDQVRDLHQSCPSVCLWVDNGLRSLDRVMEIARPVLGSESLDSLEQLSGLSAELPGAILSLDFRGDRPLGPVGLGERADLWPPEVILMTLDRVGSRLGPDFECLLSIQRKAPGRLIHAAGGVRGAGDLERLRRLGIAGALVSTALHQGRIPRSVIEQVSI